MNLDHPIGQSVRKSAMWDAIRYPSRGGEALRTVGLGTLLAPTIAIPLGYVLRVMRRPADRSDPPPLDLDEATLIDGGIAALVGGALLTPGLIAWLSGWPVIGIAITLIGVYLLPAAFIRVARGAIPDGVAFGTLLDVALTEAYARTWLETGAIGGLILVLAVVAWLSDPVLALLPAIGLGFVGPVILARRHVVTYDRLFRIDAEASADADATGVPV